MLKLRSQTVLKRSGDYDVGTYPVDNALFHYPLSRRDPEIGMVIAAVSEVWMHGHADPAKLRCPAHSIRDHTHVELKGQVVLHRSSALVCLQGRRRSMGVFSQ